MRTGRSLTVCRSLLRGGAKKNSPKKYQKKNWGGVPGPGGCTWSAGGVPGLGGAPGPRGVCTWSRRVYLVRGVSAPRGCLLQGGCTWSWGVSGLGVWYPSMHWGRHPPPVNRMTNRCKNITLATTLLRPVTRKHSSRMHTDRAVTRMSSERVAMRPIVHRMTHACENITFPCDR